MSQHQQPPVTISEWKAAQVAGGGLARLQSLVAAERLSNSETKAWISLATDQHIQSQWETLGSQDLPLYGVPFAVKDNIDAESFYTTAACPAFGQKILDEDAFVVKKLKAAGAILVGKTNLDQFATGLVGTRSPYGAVPNSFDASRVSGGSSSGSAVNVARGVVPFSLGTDTAGSGRVPAGLNNIYGLKPSRGAISTNGVLPACRSLDCVSIFALTAEDAELVLRTAEGFDTKDAYSRTRTPIVSNGFGHGLRNQISNKRPTLAICKEPEWYGQNEQALAYEAALQKCTSLGWKLVPMSFDSLFALAQLLYEGPWVAERYAAISDFFKTSHADMDPTVRGIISRAEKFSAADAFSAEYLRQDLTREVHSLFDSFDGLLVPTSPTFPTLEEVAQDPVHANSKLGTYTNFVNFLDWCALSIPAGFRSDGLPFGITLISNTWQEYELLGLAHHWNNGETKRLGATTSLSPSTWAAPVHKDDIAVAPITPPNTIAIAVVGAHLRGFPLNKDLTSRGGVFHQCTTTSATYRLFALANTKPRKPGLRRVTANEQGREIEVEIWHLPKACFADFMGTIPFPLGIGQVELSDHTWVNGFVCESSALEGALDITEFGSWRAYTKSLVPDRKKITSVLIANRGEIALRISKTLKKMGLKSVAIYVEADASTPHVREADLAFRLDGNTVSDTYLNASKIIEIAKTAGVDAIIPGYGFLSENADFAKMVEDNGILWVGPTPDQMSDLGLKHRAREIAQQAEVPTIQGSTKLVASLEDAISETKRIGFPVMLKSTAGGGGIGLRHCPDMESLEEAFYAVQRLATANFGDDGIFVEKYIRNARHVEVQILGDGTGQVITAGERDCSLQRRHQKVVEESPALMVPSHIRDQMKASAIRLASSVNYRNVGTVEFIYDIESHEFYFLEVNTRLQVEHPVTESVSGLDLVQCMLDIAAQDCGELFGRHDSSNITCNGVSIEARVYAEDAVQSFKPCAGRITRVEFPESLRVDSWIEEGTEVSTSYDPMLAKLIATGKDRDEAIEKLSIGLKQCVIDGVQNNLNYLRQIVDSDTFRSGSYTTKTLDTFRFISPCMEILKPGGHMTVQDFPGRTGLWNIGVPTSGPMDDLSFRLANQLVGNADSAAALECTMKGPSIRFHCDTVIAVTGADCAIQIDGEPAIMYQAVPIRAGQILECGTFESGYRAYIAIAHGINVPTVMGSKSTFELAKLGGFHGRRLEAGDVVDLYTSSEVQRNTVETVPRTPIPPQPNAQWKIGVIPGPHGAPEVFTPEGLQTLFDAEWDVHYNSNRLGIRLRGVRPTWARSDGGTAGLHPSNIHDTPYSVGSISFTGDEAIVLSVDGPSLGGFVVFCVVASTEMWKLGQVRPGDKIKLRPIPIETTLNIETPISGDSQIFNIPDVLAQTSERTHEPARYSSLVGECVHRGIKITARQAGDCAMLLEFGDEHEGFQVRQSFEIVTFIKQHGGRPIQDIKELTPGVRSIHIQYRSQVDPQTIFSRLVAHVHSYQLPSKVESREVRLPFAFNDKVSQAAVQRYSETIRAHAPWLPSNVKFLEQLNGIGSLEHIFQQSTFLVLGLGDVFLGSPCAISLDPRSRLFGTKYNPSRSHTPRGSVGLGGQYMCIYATESPGGYQLVGRTTDIWNSTRIQEHNSKTYQDSGSVRAPWLFRLFDRISFYPVSESDLDSKSPAELVTITDGDVDLAEYEGWLAKHEQDITETASHRARSRDSVPFMDELVKPYDEPTLNTVLDGFYRGESVRAPMPGRCWKVYVRKGARVKKGEALVSHFHTACEVQIDTSHLTRTLFRDVSSAAKWKWRCAVLLTVSASESMCRKALWCRLKMNCLLLILHRRIFRRGICLSTRVMFGRNR